MNKNPGGFGAWIAVLLIAIVIAAIGVGARWWTAHQSGRESRQSGISPMLATSTATGSAMGLEQSQATVAAPSLSVDNQSGLSASVHYSNMPQGARIEVFYQQATGEPILTKMLTGTSGSMLLTLPVNSKAGKYYVVAVQSEDNAVEAKDADGNVYPVSGWITVPNGYDFMVPIFSNGEPTGLMANHSTLYIPDTEVYAATTLTTDDGSNPISFSDPEHMTVFGNVPHYGQWYLVDGKDVYSITSMLGKPLLSLVSGVDGKTLVPLGDSGNNFWRDVSGIYCWEDGAGGGGGIGPQYLVFRAPLNNLITIRDVYSNSPANADSSKPFTFATIEDEANGYILRYKLTTTDRYHLCAELKNVSVVPISADEEAFLNS